MLSPTRLAIFSICIALANQGLLGCATTNSFPKPSPVISQQKLNQAESVARPTKSVARPTKSVARPTKSTVSQNEPKLEGIPLSCRIEYMQSLQRESLNFGDSDYRNHFVSRSSQAKQKVLQTYLQAKQYEQGLNFFIPGSDEWVELARLAIVTDLSGQKIADLEAALWELDSDRQHQVMGELYLAAEQPEMALQEWKARVPANREGGLTGFFGMNGWDYRSRGQLAVTFIKQGKRAAAEQLIAPIIEISKQDNARTADVRLFPIAEAYAETGLLDESLDFSSQHLSSWLSKGVVLNQVAKGYLLAGQRARGLAVLDEAKQISLDNQEYVRKVRPATNVPRIDLRNTILGYVQAGEYQTAKDLAATSGELDEISVRIAIAKQILKNGDITLAAEILQETRQRINKIDLEDDIFITSLLPKNLKEIADVYADMEQIDLSKQALSDSFYVIQRPFLARFAQSENQDALISGYTRLGDYESAKRIADIEKNSYLRDLLLNLIQCSSTIAPPRVHP